MIECCLAFIFPRRKLDQANEKLRKVLIEMIRTTIATEDLIGQKISAGAKTSEQATLQRSSMGSKDAKESGQIASDSYSNCRSCYVSEAKNILLAHLRL